MRKEGLGRLLRLALLLEGSRVGLTLLEMAEALGVSPRTVQRMIAALEAELPRLEALGEPGGVKRWRLPRGVKGALAQVTAEEQATLGHAARIARRQGDFEAADRLDSLAAKLPVLLDPSRARRLAPDVEALLLASGVAHRPGPRERVDEAVLDALREAILAGVWIEADHRAKATGRLSRAARLGPVALLLGEGRRYLLAFSAYAADLRLYALPGFERVRPLPEPFERPEGFDLDDWLLGSFGTWREAPQDVVWRFVPDAADEAAAWVFHPAQEAVREPDGSLTVRFRSGGFREMAWHLVRWGDRVEALAPERLREELREHAAQVLRRCGAHAQDVDQAQRPPDSP